MSDGVNEKKKSAHQYNRVITYIKRKQESNLNELILSKKKKILIVEIIKIYHDDQQKLSNTFFYMPK